MCSTVDHINSSPYQYLFLFVVLILVAISISLALYFFYPRSQFYQNQSILGLTVLHKYHFSVFFLILNGYGINVGKTVVNYTYLIVVISYMLMNQI